MSRFQKLLEKVLNGRSDNNIGFDELQHLLKKLGFNERIKGSHHIFWMNGVDEICNLQARNGMAKGYQVKQVRELIVRYKLGIQDE